MVTVAVFLLLISGIIDVQAQSTSGKADTQIVGGVNAVITQYPYQVSIMIDDVHKCGGAILSRLTIITAAHCTNDYKLKPARFKIRAGSSIQGSGGVVIQVTSITQHPNYNDNTVNNDVSLLKLRSRLSYGNAIKAVTLARVVPPTGTIGVATGWGRLAETDPTSFQLQAVDLPVFDKTLCIAAYLVFYFRQVTDKMICVGYEFGGKGSCQGDSGGPYVINGTLVGLVSWAGGCAKPEIPSVFTNLPSLYTWISNNIVP